MKEMRLKYSILRMCRFFRASPSGYYKWLNAPPSRYAREEARLEIEIRAAHKRTRETCGPERLQADLAEHGVKAGICKIRRIRKKLGLRCKQVKKFKATTDSKHTLPVAENLLKQDFKAMAPNKVWVSDLTYVATEEGWLYCAAHKDLFNGEIVGYALGHRMATDLVKESLLKAVNVKRPLSGLIHHSDRGCQYCSQECRKLLERFGMEPSMSRKGNCYDNAPMESFWGTLKNELVHHRRYATREEARRDITEYIEIFITGSGVRDGLAIYPLWHMESNSTPGVQRHEKYFVSTIDIRGHLRQAARSDLYPVRQLCLLEEGLQGADKGIPGKRPQNGHRHMRPQGVRACLYVTGGRKGCLRVRSRPVRGDRLSLEVPWVP